MALINPRDEGDGPSGDVVSTIRARDMWNEIAQSAWKTGDPGVVFIDRVWETAERPEERPTRSWDKSRPPTLVAKNSWKTMATAASAP